MRHIRVFLIAVFLLGACQSEVEVTPTTVEPTGRLLADTNQFIVWGTSALTAELDALMVELFTERHPDMEVVLVDAGWDEALRQNFLNAAQMGRPPDILIGENYFRSFANDNLLMPVDSVLAQYDDLLAGSAAAGFVDGVGYAVPYFTGTFALERNCDVIYQAGLDCSTLPITWSDFVEETEMITDYGLNDYYGFSLQGPGGSNVGAAFRIAVFQAQLDALPCADDACTVPDFDRPDGVRVLEFLRELHAHTPPGLSENPNEGEVYEALFRGVSAYQVGASWHPGWAESVGCEACRYAPMPRPINGQRANMLVGNVLYAAPANTPHPELALEWLSLLLSDEVQDRIYDTTGRLPVRTDILMPLRETVDASTAVFIDELLASRLYILPQWEHEPGATWAIYNQMLHEVLHTDRPIEEITAEAQAAVEAIGP